MPQVLPFASCQRNNGVGSGMLKLLQTHHPNSFEKENQGERASHADIHRQRRQKPTLVSCHTFVSRTNLTTSSLKLAMLPQDRQTSERGRAPTHSPAAYQDTGLLCPGSARRAQPHASPTAGDGNSLHIHLLLLERAVLIFCQSFLANSVTTAPK